MSYSSPVKLANAYTNMHLLVLCIFDYFIFNHSNKIIFLSYFVSESKISEKVSRGLSNP